MTTTGHNMYIYILPQHNPYTSLYTVHTFSHSKTPVQTYSHNIKSKSLLASPKPIITNTKLHNCKSTIATHTSTAVITPLRLHNYCNYAAITSYNYHHYTIIVITQLSPSAYTLQPHTRTHAPTKIM